MEENTWQCLGTGLYIYIGEEYNLTMPSERLSLCFNETPMLVLGFSNQRNADLFLFYKMVIASSVYTISA